MAVISIDRTRRAWSCAAAFSADKETCYPDHAAAQEFDHHHDKRVLEYGCGGGSDAMSFMRRGNDVTYADVVPFNVGAASKRIAAAGLTHRATPLVLEASSPIPLPDASFDLISSHGVLHHIVDPTPVVAEFARLLRSGGFAYVMLYSEHLRARLDARVTQLVTWNGLSEAEAFCWLTDEPGCPYARPYSESEGCALLEGAGFVVERTVLYNKNDFRTLKAVKP